LPDPGHLPEPTHETVLQRQQAFGYTFEDLRILMVPMAKSATSVACFFMSLSPVFQFPSIRLPNFAFFRTLMRFSEI